MDSKGKAIYQSGYDVGTNLEETYLKFIKIYYKSHKATGIFKVKEVKQFLEHIIKLIKSVKKISKKIFKNIL